MIHSQDPSQNCDCNRFNDQTLKDGCNNFKALQWNNPQVSYEELSSCPDELVKSPPCWEDNGETWPLKAPDTCAAPAKPSPGPTPTPPGPTPTPGCPGGNLAACIGLCPSTPAIAFQACVGVCSTRCKSEEFL